MLSAITAMPSRLTYAVALYVSLELLCGDGQVFYTLIVLSGDRQHLENLPPLRAGAADEGGKILLPRFSGYDGVYLQANARLQ